MSTATQTQKIQANPKNIVEALREKVKSSEVFKEVMMTFAMRERARTQVTIQRLMYTMEQEGYKFTREQLLQALEDLANVGVGTLKKDSKGKVSAVVNIKYTLQTVGKAALGSATKVDKFAPQQRLERLVAPKAKDHPEMAAKEFEDAQPISPCKVILKANVDGADIEFFTGLTLSKTELINLIAKLQTEYRSKTL